MATRTCPACGGSFPDDWEFCPRDAAPLPAPPGATPPAASAPVDKNLGRLIAHRFVLQRRLGSGATGTVYLATHHGLDRFFAVKLLHFDLTDDERAGQRFRREAHAISLLDHPHLVRLYDYGDTGSGEPFLAMEYVEGPVLSDVLHASAGGKLPPDRAVDIALQVGRALAHAHARSVIHRDVKPENILLSQEHSQPDWVKLVDFGLAKVTGEAGLTRPSDGPSGTPCYMAPELWHGGPAGGPATDLYAIGVLLHMMLVGKPPFDGTNAALAVQHLTRSAPRLSDQDRELRIPTSLERLAGQLLLKDPAQRPDAPATVTTLEQVRALLPKHSLRGLMLMQTVLLQSRHPHGPAGPAGGLAAAPTLMLPEQRRDLAEMMTRLLPRVTQIDHVEAGRRETEAGLESELQALQRRWPQGFGAEPQALLRRLDALRHDEDRLGLDLALCKDELAAQQTRRQLAAGAARQASLDLSQMLQNSEGEAPYAEQRRQLLLQLQKQDRILIGLLDEGSEENRLRARHDTLRRQIDQTREQRNHALIHLSRLLAAAPPPRNLPDLPAQQGRIAVLAKELDNATVLLSRIMGEPSGADRI